MKRDYLPLLIMLLVGIADALMTKQQQIDSTQCRVIPLELKYFNRSGNKGYCMDCSLLNITQVPQRLPLPNSSFTPPLRELLLSWNSIQEITDDSFNNITHLNTSDLMWLYLDNNQIRFINADAFRNLSNLRYLTLKHNLLHWPGSYAQGLFRHLVSLENLVLKENQFDNFTDLGFEFQNFRTKLRGLYINPGNECKFGPDFKHLTRLVDLSLTGQNETACSLTNVAKDMFIYVSNVKNLWMSSCSIEHIDAAAFAPLVNIDHLDISYNEGLNFTGMNVALTGLKNSSTLRTLNVNHINPFWEAGITLTSEHMENIKTLRNLETLHMDLNKIEVFSFCVLLLNYFPATLRNLTLSGNRLTYGKYVRLLATLRNVTFIDISRQHLTYDPFFAEHFEPTNQFLQPNRSVTTEIMFDKLDECLLSLPPDVRVFKWRKSFLHAEIPHMRICNASSLHTLDLSFNMLYQWTGPVKGLETLKHLDLSDNTCTNVSELFFKHFVSLKHLNISNNALGISFNPEKNMHAGDILKSVKNLTRLDMSHNGLYNLSKIVFSELSLLEELYLKNNQLREFDVDLTNSKCIRNISLSDNKLPNLKKPFMDYLDSLVDQKCNRNHNVTLDMSMNALTCECADLPFWQWSESTKVVILMKNKDGCTIAGKRYQLETGEDLYRLLRDLETFCKDLSWEKWLIAGGGTLLGTLLSAFIGFFVFKYRWKLRYIYYARNKRFRHEGFERLFANDAMISYAKSNAGFIKDSFMPAMSSRGLSVWVADKHSIPGVSVAENIIHAIYSSRKTVLLIDREYTKDSWCDYEMNMALVESVETKRKLIIVVLMGDLEIGRLPIGIWRFLRNECLLEYPQDEADYATFWNDLATEINS